MHACRSTLEDPTVACVDTRIEKPYVQPPGAEAFGLIDLEGATATLDTANAPLFTAELASMGETCGWGPPGSRTCTTPEECLEAFQCAGIDEVSAALESVLAAAFPPESATAPPTLPEIRAAFEGYALVHRVCSGALGIVDEEANGFVELTMGFTDGGLDPVIAGTFERCHVLRATTDREVIVDGVIAVSLADEPVRRTTDIRFVVSMDVTITIDGEAITIAQAYYLDPSLLRFATVVVVGEGEAVVFAVDGGRTGFVTADGRYDCDYEAQTCVREDGSVVSW